MLKAFEKRVLRKKFGPIRAVVTEEWKKLHNKELYDLRFSQKTLLGLFKQEQLSWAGHVVCIKKSRGAYRILMGKSEENRPLGRPRPRWDGNIEMDLKETGREEVELLMRDRCTHQHTGTRF